MATTGTLMTAENIYGLVNPPPDPSSNNPLVHQTINSGAVRWDTHVDLSNAVVRVTTNQTIGGDKTFTGTIIAPTPVESDNTTKIATTAFVKTSIDNLVDSAPNNLNTLNELAAAINDDNNFHNTVTTALAGKQPSITSSARLNANLIGANGNVSNTEYGYLNGVTSAIQTQINAKHPSITSSARLNANLIGANGNVSNTEFGYLDGVTSSIQTQINGKQNVIGAFTRLNANLIGDNGNVGNTEFGYLDGVTSSIQTQIDSKQATITDGDLTIARTSGLQSALDLKAPLAGPTFTGTPSAPTATAGTNTTQLATTAFVKTAVDNLVDNAPGALDTLNELAAAIGDDANYAATVTTALAAKHPSITTSARLNANLIGDNGDVSNTEYGYLNGVTSAIQTQIDSKQATIGDGDLTIARTNGLQVALDSKQPNITTTSDISLNNIGISGDISSNGGFSFAGHIIPKTNSQYDLGSAEYKIRHLYLSDNSLWLGENHKIEVSGGQMRFRKIKKNELPTGISNNFAGASLTDAITVLGKDPASTIDDFTLADWEHYSVLKGTPLRVDQIFLPDDINDDGGVLGTISGTDVSLNKLEVANDLSANDISSNNLQIRSGYKLYADTINETTSASGVTVDSVLLKDGDISANGIQLSNLVVRSGGFLFANTINETTSASGVTVDGVLLKDGHVFCNDICGNDISANDISSNNLQVNGGGELFVDKISESTDSSGVTIDSVLLKDNQITAHTITAQNYRVGNVNFISASRQGNFRDLEVKDSNNNHTILLTGDGGHIAIDGTLSADTIGEKTSATGVTIDGVLLKDNDISANDISSNNLQVRAGYKLYADTIDESSAGTGVTIDGVLLKDNNVTCTDLTASGTTTVTTQSATDNSTKIATTAFVKTAIDNLIDGAPGTMDTLKELSTALDNNNSYATTITLQLAQKAPKADPTFTGTPLGPTATAGTNTTQLATTAFVQTAISGKQDTIGDGDLTIARTNGLQAALDAKQASLTTSARLNADLIAGGTVDNTEFGYIHGVTSSIQTQLDSKQATIGDGDLTIARTNGLQAALDAKQATIGDGDLTIARTNGLQAALDGKQASLTSIGSGSIISATERTDFTDVSNNAVRITGNQTIAGSKTFSSAVTIGNYTLPTVAGTQGQVLKYPASGSTLTWGSGGGGGGSSIDSTTDVSMNDLEVFGDISCNAVKLGGHIIPDTNAAYDLGNAEYKIRHLFLSDNSLWIGDNHKIDIVSGKMKFKKRKTNVVPAAITAASGTDSAAIAHAGVSSLAEMKLHHWEAYAHTLSGLETSNIKDIFVSGTAGDWEEDQELGASSSTTTKKGQVLETLTGIADGRTVTVESGSYTLTNVTSTQITTNSYADITGTSITYTPPTGTKQVIFKYHINMSPQQGGSGNQNNQGLILMQMTIDGTAVTSQIQAWGDGYSNFGEGLLYTGIIDINGTDSVSNGTLASWTSGKTVKLRVVGYSDNTYHVKLHANEYGALDTSNDVTDTLIKPRIEINSIGEGTVGAVSNAVTTSGDQTISGTKTFSNAIISASYTTTQRDALTPVAGMVIFNTTVNKHQGYNGSSWNDFY